MKTVFFLYMLFNMNHIIFSQDAEFYFLRGFKKCYESKDYYGAITDYLKAIELGKEKTVVLAQIGDAKIQLKDYRGAIKDLDNAILIQDNNWLARYYRGIARSFLINDGLYTKSDVLMDLQQVERLADVNIEIGKSILKTTHELLDELDIIKEAGNFFRYRDYGDKLFNIQDYKGAIDAYNKALSFKVEVKLLIAEIYMKRGLAKSSLNDCYSSIGDWDKAIELSPLSAKAWYLKSSCKLFIGDINGACNDLKQAAKIDVDFKEVPFGDPEKWKIN